MAGRTINSQQVTRNSPCARPVACMREAHPRSCHSVAGRVLRGGKSQQILSFGRHANGRFQRGSRQYAAATEQLTEFTEVKTEEQFKDVLLHKVDAKILPKELVPGMLDFYNNYKYALLGSEVPGADEALVASVMSAIADRSADQFVNPYTFPSFHTRILEPYDYYEFGQRYVRGLINFDKSVVGNTEVFEKIEAQLAAGENVVLLANHQTEADPAVWALLLEKTFPRLATDIVYVAGDRVVTDPLCKCFSMGRNLFCVHSKKRLDDIPELKAAKQKQNRMTLVQMTKKFNEGGQLVWIAPSGGRDRPNEEGTWLPAAFDGSAVELMRTLLTKAAPKGHLYPFAMSSWGIMPPPQTLEKEMGERRLTYYAPCGISACPELDVDDIVGGSGTSQDVKAERAQSLANVAFEEVTKEFQAITAAMEDPSARGTKFVQLWKE